MSQAATSVIQLRALLSVAPDTCAACGKPTPADLCTACAADISEQFFLTVYQPERIHEEAR